MNLEDLRKKFIKLYQLLDYDIYYRDYYNNCYIQSLTFDNFKKMLIIHYLCLIQNQNLNSAESGALIDYKKYKLLELAKISGNDYNEFNNYLQFTSDKHLFSSINLRMALIEFQRENNEQNVILKKERIIMKNDEKIFKVFSQALQRNEQLANQSIVEMFKIFGPGAMAVMAVANIDASQYRAQLIYLSKLIFQKLQKYIPNLEIVKSPNINYNNKLYTLMNMKMRKNLLYVQPEDFQKNPFEEWAEQIIQFAKSKKQDYEKIFVYFGMTFLLNQIKVEGQQQEGTPFYIRLVVV